MTSFSAGCADPKDDDLLLRRVFEGLGAFRLSREIQDGKARFLELARIAEHLAKRSGAEKLRGHLLRDRISQVAAKGWMAEGSIDAAVVVDLWDNVRNPLTHSAAPFPSINRDAAGDLMKMEEIVVGMIRAIVIAWSRILLTRQINPLASA